METLVFVRTSKSFRAALLAAVMAVAAAGCDDDASGEAEDGLAGEDGDKGDDGNNGVNGQDGDDGDQGAAGPAGPQGDDGETGVTGATGATGEDGDDGDDGRNAGDLDFGVAAAIPFSNLGHDRLYGAVYDDVGNLFVTGMIADDVVATADSKFLLAKFLPSGYLDESFGTGGVAQVNVAVGGESREMARGIVIQESSGAIVIAGQAEHDTAATGLAAADLDIFVARFTAAGVLDTTFNAGGTRPGVFALDLNAGIEGVNNQNMPAWTASDSQYGLVLDGDERLIIHGSQRATGTGRTDVDFALVRLTEDGVLDTTFNASGARPGVVTLDLVDANSTHAGASARAATVLADDSVVAFGYLTSEVLGENTQQPLLYKVDDAGAFDATFAAGTDPDQVAAPGVWHGLAVAPPLTAEAYGGALQGTSIVTMGYGPTPNADGTGPDWVSFRFTEDGVLDETYGDGGRVHIDAGGYGDNGRFVMVLPDDRILGAGVGRAAPEDELPEGEQPEADAMVAILLEDGAPDTDFGPGGVQLYDVGGNADHFWSGAVSPDGTRAAIVGIAGADPDGSDDDAALLLLRLPD